MSKILEYIVDFLTNPFVINTAVTWCVAQVTKLVVHTIVYKEFDIKRLWGDGGMPSGHSATVASLATLAGIRFGFGSFEFAVAAILAIVVCRDAVGVRMETGKQTVVINELRDYIKDMGNGDINEIKLKEFVGHTPSQVVIGLILGVLVSVVMSFILKV